MFLLKIGVPQTCFGIALSWSSSKNRTLDTQRIHQDKLIKQGIQFPHGRIVNLAKTEIITKGPLARGAKQRHHLTGLCRDQCYNSWKYVPTIISDRDSDLIGVRIFQTHQV